MQGKILFIDVDGTLLDSRHELRERTKNALTRAHEQGHVIVIASGRCVRGIEPVSKLLPFSVYLSSLNGAYITDDRGNVVSQSPIPVEDGRVMASLIKKYGLGHLYFPSSDWGSGDEDCYQLEASVIRTEGLHLSLEEVIEERAVHKILAVGDQKGEGIKGFLEESKRLFPSYMIMPSSAIYIEINTPGTSKGAAIDRVCAYLGADVKDTIAFGDYDNDISMFQEAGYAVCLANGSGAAKAAADTIAPSNDEDGLAYWIEQNLIH